MKVVLLGKRGDAHAEKAAAYLRNCFDDVSILWGKRPEPIPESLGSLDCDLLISYLCPWVVPPAVLRRVRKASINFHPATPDYPGTGCTNFAVYEHAAEFGATCHYMAAAVDTGALIGVRRFSRARTDSVWRTTQRAYAEMYLLFEEVLDHFLRHGSFPSSKEIWTRQPFRRSDLEKLCRLERNMTWEEITRRVRAVTFPNMPGAFLDGAKGRREIGPISEETLCDERLLVLVLRERIGRWLEDGADSIDPVTKLQQVGTV